MATNLRDIAPTAGTPVERPGDRAARSEDHTPRPARSLPGVAPTVEKGEPPAGSAMPEPPNPADQYAEVRSFFETPTQQQLDERMAARSRNADQLRSARKRRRLTEAELMELLGHDIRAAGDAHIRSVQDSGIIAPGFTTEEREHKLTAMHRIHAEQMVMAGMRPLQEGVSPASVARVMTTMSAMFLLSPNFRAVMGERFEPFLEAVRSRVDKTDRDKAYVARKLRRAEDRKNAKDNLARLTNRITGSSFNQDNTIRPDRSTRRMLDSIERRQRGHREIFTAESAAKAEMGLAMQAFALMREPYPDPDLPPGMSAAQAQARRKEAREAHFAGIQETYHALTASIYRQAEEDGVPRDQVARASRILVGTTSQFDPQVMVMLNGFAHGERRMAEPRTRRIEGTDRGVSVWNGDFESCLGQPVDPSYTEDDGTGQRLVKAAYQVRPPQTADEHRVLMRSVMETKLAVCAEGGDVQGFGEMLGGYMASLARTARDFEGRDQPVTVTNCLREGRTMQAAMLVDGLTVDQRRLQYTLAVVDSVEAIRIAQPEFARKFGELRGSNMETFIALMGTDTERAFAIIQQPIEPESEPEAEVHADTEVEAEAGAQAEPDAGPDREPPATATEAAPPQEADSSGQAGAAVPAGGPDTAEGDAAEPQPEPEVA